MPTSEIDRIRDQIAAMQSDIAEGKQWMAVHDVSCAARYRELKESMERSNKLLLLATTVLAVVAIGLKTKFGEEILRMTGLL